VRLPAETDVSVEVLNTIATRHGVDTGGCTRLADAGIFNTVYLLGEQLVLRVPRAHPGHVDALYREAVVVPAARRAGVRTPSLVALDDTRVLLPVPYAIYERVPGQTLASVELDPAHAAPVWRELGHDLASVHGVTVDLLPEQEALPDPRELLEPRAHEGWFTGAEARWLNSWLDRLALLAPPPAGRCVLHGDSQATNVMVQTNPVAYRAVIDWGSAAWGDAANDFAGVPLRAVPFMLEGHRDLAPLEPGIEARIVWRHLQLALLTLPRGAVPGRSWAERPLAMLLEIVRFFLARPGGAWADLGPG